MNQFGYGRPSSAPSTFCKSVVVVLTMFHFWSLSAAEAAEVVRGPYLQVVTPSSVIVRWRTDVPTDARVRYGKAAGSLTDSALANASGTEHSVKLSGLSPATRYYYDVGSSAGALAGDSSFSFTTAPAPGSSSPVRVWVTGDPGKANSGAVAVRDSYKSYSGAEQTNLWLMLGDNAYQDGTDAEYQRAIFEIYPELLRKVPVYSAFGNHDGHSADSGNESGPYYDIFTFPRNAEAGGLPSGTEAYYSFDYGNIHFVSLDSYGSDDDFDGPMMTWLRNDLSATDKDWVIAFWHHPPYSKGSHDSDTSSTQTQMREVAVKILESYGVDLVLSGHSHAYERSALMDGHYGLSDTFSTSMQVDGGNGREDSDGAYSKVLPRQPNQGAVYVVAGNASSVSSSGALDHPAMLVSMRELGSLVLDVAGNRLDLSFIDDGGNRLDYFTISKGDDTTPPSIRAVETDSPTTIELVFSETLDKTSAETVSNYSLAPAGITASAADPEILDAQLSADGRTVILTTSPLQTNVTYELSVANVADADSNVIEAGATAEVEYTATATTSFQNGVLPDASYAGAEDTFISEGSPTSNYGSERELDIDGDDAGSETAGLIRWDISAIPANATIESATISVDVTGSSSDNYNLYAVEKNWLESGATWNATGISGAWSTAGATGSGDFAPNVLASFNNMAIGSQTVPLNSAGLAVLQSWVSGQKDNRGFILRNSASTDGLRFASSEDSPASRPRLTVTYSTVEATDGPLPEAPYNVEPVIIGKYGLWIAWSEPADKTRLLGYQVKMNGRNLGLVEDRQIQVVDLQAGTQYKFSVAAVYSDGTTSDAATLSVKTLAANYYFDGRWYKAGKNSANKSVDVPYGFRVIDATDASLWIAWNQPAESAGVEGYRVWLDGADKGVVGTTEYQVSGLSPSTEYRFSVAAMDTDGNLSPQVGFKATTLLAGDVGGDSGSSGSGDGSANLAPVISGTPATTALVGVAYNFRPSASDPDGSPAGLTFDIVNMPGWAQFDNGTGRLWGTPAASNIGKTTGITISVSDGGKSASLAEFDLTVQAAPVANEGTAGVVKFFVDGKADFTPWTDNPTEAQKAVMLENYYRMQVYSPYGDRVLEWFPNSWEYEDAYKISPGGSVDAEHPEWILRDAAGNKLYIPFACSGGTCPQYAGDMGNPEFRRFWIDRLAQTMAKGYKGIFVDDLNMLMRVGNGYGDKVTPIDPRTGAPMTFADWQRYVAEFSEEIRAAFPTAEIAHNVIYWSEPADGNDEWLIRQAMAADYINLERGATTDGMRGGTGKYGFETFLSYIDWAHGLGKNVTLDDDDSDTIRERDLELAVYFLINNGGDMIGADGDRSRMNPDNFWSGYRTNLGEALGDRYKENGIFRRDFQCGVTLVNQPEEPSRTIDLGENMIDLEGNSVRSVTLGPAEGEVLVGACL
ncbi:MAG: DNRLRE domain-containing protein [Gammaproteobacteria bacterium]|jgi:chitodextrinase